MLVGRSFVGPVLANLVHFDEKLDGERQGLSSKCHVINAEDQGELRQVRLGVPEGVVASGSLIGSVRHGFNLSPD